MEMTEMIEVIETSPLFDGVWYKKTYQITEDEAKHYLETGWKLGFDPSRAFSTCEYLKLYPDVAAAHMNPLLHYELHGKNEGRMPELARFVNLTADCNLDGKGLEIGPSFNPICPKSKGYDIEIIDHCDAAGLRKKYGNDQNVQDYLERIEEVDYVWNGGDYCTLTGKANYYDYILASHLIEHTTDFIGFFEQCAALLKDDGILSLAVPNKYYSFDFFRENTSLSQVIDKHFSDQNHHSKGGILEYFTGAVKLDGHIAWNQRIFQESSDFSFIHEKGQGLKFAESRDFFDIHEWVFTPGSFRILINDLWELGYIDFHEKSFYVDGENSCEFIITLKKAASPVNMAFDQKTRMELRQYRMKEELAFWESVKQFEFSDKLRFQ